MGKISEGEIICLSHLKDLPRSLVGLEWRSIPITLLSIPAGKIWFSAETIL